MRASKANPLLTIALRTTLTSTLAIGCAGLANADITLTFADSTADISTEGRITSAKNPIGAVLTTFRSGKEFRMVDPTGTLGGGAPAQKNTINGGEQWIFNSTTRLFSSAVNTGTTGGTEGGGGDSDGGTSIDQGAIFLQEPFGFLAPIVGTPAATAYGAAIYTQKSNTKFEIFFPVLEAQWAGKYFPMGQVGGGITMTGELEADRHTFILYGEEMIDKEEDPGTAGFSGWTGQWMFTGQINQDPVATNLEKGMVIGDTLTISTSDLGSDADGDTLTISGTDSSSLTNATLNCGTTSCTYTTAVTSTQTFTVSMVDGISAAAVTATVTIVAEDNPKPTAKADVAEVDQGASVAISVLANDDDQSALDPSSVTIVTAPTKGTAVVTSDATLSGTFITYTPNVGAAGVDTFTYTVNDDGNPTANVKTSDVATVTVTINPKAVAPTAASGVLGTGSIGTILVSASDLSAANIPVDTSVVNQCDPDCFDFVITNLASDIVSIVLPLSGPIPAGSQYKKYVDGAWVTFTPSGTESVKSAAGSLGSCPAPDDSAYGPITAGHFCLQITIKDNGVNDTDPTAGQIADPGGLANGEPAPVEFAGESISGGCSLSNREATAQIARAEWWLLFGFVAWVTLARKRCLAKSPNVQSK